MSAKVRSTDLVKTGELPWPVIFAGTPMVTAWLTAAFGTTAKGFAPLQLTAAFPSR